MNHRKLLRNIPEILLAILASTMVYTNGAINYIFLLAAILMVVLVITENRIMGMVMGSVTLLFSLFMMLAVFSEFAAFSKVNSEALTLVGVGVLLCLTTLFCAVFILKKYSNRSINHNQLATKDVFSAS